MSVGNLGQHTQQTDSSLENEQVRYFNPHGDRRPGFCHPTSLTLNEECFPFSTVGEEDAVMQKNNDYYQSWQRPRQLQLSTPKVHYQDLVMWSLDPMRILQSNLSFENLVQLQLSPGCMFDPEHVFSKDDPRSWILDPFNGCGGFGGFRDLNPDWESSAGSEGNYALSYHSSQCSEEREAERAYLAQKDNGFKSLGRDAFSDYESIPTGTPHSSECNEEADEETNIAKEAEKCTPKSSGEQEEEEEEGIQEDLLALEEDGFGCALRPQSVSKKKGQLLFGRDGQYWSEFSPDHLRLTLHPDELTTIEDRPYMAYWRRQEENPN